MMMIITTLIVLIILQQEDVPVQLEALDILSDLLSRFGSKLTTLSSLSEPMTRHSLICFQMPCAFGYIEQILMWAFLV